MAAAWVAAVRPTQAAEVAAAAAATTAIVFWRNLSADCQALEDGTAPEALATAPLWSEAIPVEIASLWIRLRNSLRRAREGWEVWIDWYEARLEGGPIDKPLEEARVLIDPELWGQGPQAVNTELARLVKAAGDGQPPGPATEPQPKTAAKSPADALRKELAELQSRIDELTSAVEPLGAVPRKIDDLTRELGSAGDQVTSLQSEVAQLGEDIGRFKGEHAASLQETGNQREVVFEEIAAQRERLEQTFLAETTFEAPVELWEEKRKEHERLQNEAYARFGYGLYGTVAFVLVLLLSIAVAGTAFDQFIAPEKGFSARSVLVIGGILTLITLLLWFTRLQMRIYLSERHLALDARERRAFAQAYVAMLKGEVSKEAQEDMSSEDRERVFKDARQQRGLVYAALFRPTKEGMVKEDAGLDPTLTAAISKLLMK